LGATRFYKDISKILQRANVQTTQEGWGI
jgi:hypothetical protein